jgi:hypothetical protein
MPVAAMFVSPAFDLNEAMMAPELCNPKMDPVLISKQVFLPSLFYFPQTTQSIPQIPRIEQLVKDSVQNSVFSPAEAR